MRRPAIFDEYFKLFHSIIWTYSRSWVFQYGPKPQEVVRRCCVSPQQLLPIAALSLSFHGAGCVPFSAGRPLTKLCAGRTTEELWQWVEGPLMGALYPVGP